MLKQKSLDFLTFTSWFIAGVYSVLLLVMCLHWAGFYWNLTDSVPVGIYRRTNEPLIPGALVSFCLPTTQAKFGYERGYIKKVPWWSFLRECPGGYQPLLKHIVAIRGDIVDVQEAGVRINDVPIPNRRTQLRDSYGRPLPHVTWGEYQLQPGQLWVMGTLQPDSWDSLYYDAISSDQVLRTVAPWFVWGTAEAGQ